MRSLPVPVALAVCTFLRYVASGDLQLTVGDSTGLSQATVSRVCAQGINILASRVPVQFPAGADANRAKQELGAIAGTWDFQVHWGESIARTCISKKPVYHVEDYIERNGVPTINVQLNETTIPCVIFMAYGVAPFQIAQAVLDLRFPFIDPSFSTITWTIQLLKRSLKTPTDGQILVSTELKGNEHKSTEIIFDANYYIRDMVARWPGSVHDARELRNSGVYQFMEENIDKERHQYLLEDSGYPCKRWLLAPFLRPDVEHQVNRNM